MNEGRPQMDAPTMLRWVRHMLAKVNRNMLQLQIREDGTTHGIPLASCAARRDKRLFERRVLNSRALHRVAAAYASRTRQSNEFDLYSLVGLLRYLSSPPQGTTLRALAEESKKLREDVETTVRVLRKFAELGAVNTKRESYSKWRKTSKASSYSQANPTRPFSLTINSSARKATGGHL